MADVRPQLLSDYQHRGARALVLLHERHLPACVETWRRAKRAGIELPQTEDPNYASMETLLLHILGAARRYMIWICQKLELPDPELPETPELAQIDERADEYVRELLAGWREPLRKVPPHRFEDETYASRWGPHYSIDAMLEHAVMHPIRHTFQLEELTARAAED